MTHLMGARVARGGGAAGIAAALRWALGWPGRVHRARQILGQLAALDAHELRDIGLTRLDLEAARALPLDADPSLLLRRRAGGRRR